MTLLSSRPLLLEIIKLSTTWGISGKRSSLSLKYSCFGINESSSPSLASPRKDLFPLMVALWFTYCSGYPSPL